MSIGFLPCFSNYNHKKAPSHLFYDTPAYITKVKNLMSALVDSDTPLSLKDKIGGREIKPIRPDSAGGRKILEWCGWPPNISVYRIDYGNNPFRIIFGLGNEPRLAYIYLIEIDHSSYSDKHTK